MMKNTFKLKKDDKVKIIAGKDKDKIGKILKVNQKKCSVLVENVNIVKRHTRPNAQNRQGGIVENESPINWSNVMLMCNKCMAPVRISMQILEDGKKIRVCGNCKEMIDT